MVSEKICIKCRNSYPNTTRFFHQRSYIYLSKTCKVCVNSNRKSLTRDQKDKINYSSKERKKEKIKNGFCKSCNLKAMANSQLCESHWFSNMARNAGLRDTFEDGKTVKTILEKQNYLCPYTKEKLIPGVNCSLDHILPRSRYPKLVTDLTNLEWTTILVNKSKYNMTKKEYLSLIEIIHTNFDGQYLTPITID